MANKKIYFIGEQTGRVEDEFKKALYDIFNSSAIPIRAYLFRANYGMENQNFNVVLGIMMEKETQNLLCQEIVKVFKFMFGKYEKLDIMFLNYEQEIELRKICCPFFVSKGYQINIPDFYLTSSEGYGLEKSSIACYKRKRLSGKNPHGYLLCDIFPSLIGQAYGRGEENVSQLILASRHLDFSIFSIKNWPSYVHVAIALVELSEFNYSISEDQMRLIAWGELYKFKEDIISLHSAENKK